MNKHTDSVKTTPVLGPYTGNARNRCRCEHRRVSNTSTRTNRVFGARKILSSPSTRRRRPNETCSWRVTIRQWRGEVGIEDERVIRKTKNQKKPKNSAANVSGPRIVLVAHRSGLVVYALLSYLREKPVGTDGEIIIAVV